MLFCASTELMSEETKPDDKFDLNFFFSIKNHENRGTHHECCNMDISTAKSIMYLGHFLC